MMLVFDTDSVMFRYADRRLEGPADRPYGPKSLSNASASLGIVLEKMLELRLFIFSAHCYILETIAEPEKLLTFAEQPKDFELLRVAVAQNSEVRLMSV